MSEQIKQPEQPDQTTTQDSTAAETTDAERRSLVGLLSTVGMAGALAASYGTLAAFMGRFLYPAKPATKGWMFVAEIDSLEPGDSLVYRTPSGATVNIARQGGGESVDDFIALSSTCPHLGCQVHWEGQNDRFFCPCHNGIFDPSGKAIGGPPAEAGQSLPSFPIKVAGNLLYIEVPLAELALGEGEVLDAPWRPPGPGHDPCLCPLPTSTSSNPQRRT